MTFFGTLLGLVLLIALVSWIVGYNALIKYLNWVEEAWEEADTQLKRRADLIPQLIDIMQPHVKQEQHLLEKLVEIRSRLTASHLERAEHVLSNQELTAALEAVFNLINSYPALKNDKDFFALKKQLVELETTSHRAIQAYNNTAAKYNAKIQSPPTSFVANVHGFRKLNPINELTTESEHLKVSISK
ncbi:LemA family protein [Bacillus piscicola]|uniref:LemA family protein n=1 Tax=Bacillus piscicola TaxID=1632684 RepID=UPI001F08CAD5|nr:LemA family protein [Bacillus piscicola]